MKHTPKHIYFVPGLAANSRIFEYLKLPDDWHPHYIEWLVPESKDESLEHYARRMAEKVQHPDAVLVGVSFGGVMAQEIKRLIPISQCFIISSIKSRNEMPARMHFARRTGAHKLLPTSVISHVEKYEKYVFGEVLKHRIELYKKYLSMRDELYLPWAIDHIIHWDREIPDPEVVHIHGTKDGIFPVQNIRNFIPVEGGTHIMILNKARLISKLLITEVEKHQP